MTRWPLLVILVQLLACTAPTAEAPLDAGGDAGSDWDWILMEFPRGPPRDATVATFRGRVVVYARYSTAQWGAAEEDFQNETYRYFWRPGEFTEETLIDVLPGQWHSYFFEERVRVDGTAGGPSFLLAGDGDWGVEYSRMYSEGGATTTTLTSRCDDWRGFTQRRVGAADPTGEAWMLQWRDRYRQAYDPQCPTGMCRAGDPGVGLQLWRRGADGGTEGPYCLYEDDGIPGYDFYDNRNFIQIHPLLRIGSARDAVFFSFDEQGQVTEQTVWDMPDAGDIRAAAWRGLFWPTRSSPVRRLVSVYDEFRELLPEADGGCCLYGDRIYRWRQLELQQVDGGLHLKPSVLDGLIDQPRFIQQTSRGVVVSACRPKSYEWPVLVDGGVWGRDVGSCRVRFVLMDPEGENIIKVLDNQPAWTWIAEDNGDLYGMMWGNRWDPTKPSQTVVDIGWRKLDL